MLIDTLIARYKSPNQISTDLKCVIHFLKTHLTSASECVLKAKSWLDEILVFCETTRIDWWISTELMRYNQQLHNIWTWWRIARSETRNWIYSGIATDFHNLTRYFPWRTESRSTHSRFHLLPQLTPPRDNRISGDDRKTFRAHEENLPFQLDRKCPSELFVAFQNDLHSVPYQSSRQISNFRILFALFSQLCFSLLLFSFVWYLFTVEH